MGFPIHQHSYSRVYICALFKRELLLFAGVLINLSAFTGFYLEYIYQPLLMGIVSLVAVFIPGVILMVQYKKKQNV